MEEQIPQTPPPPVPAIPATPAPLQSVTRPKTFLVVILGLVLLLGVLFAGAVLGQRGFLSGILPLGKPSPTPTLAPEPTPTPDPTADWKTYTNEKYGFEFKYPSKKAAEFLEEPYNGFCNDDKRRGVVSLLLWPEGKKLPVVGEGVGVNDVSLFIYGEENKENLSTEKWVEKNCPQLLSGYKKENYKVSDSSAVKYTGIGEGVGAPEIQPYIFLLKDNKLFYIHPYGNKDTFNQILSTFKFLDQTSSTENWKEYVNTEDNYSVKYPPIWFSRGRVENTLGGSESYLSNEDTKYVGLSKKGVYIFTKKKGRTENDSFYFKQAKETKGAENLTVGGQPAVKVKTRTANMSGMGDQEWYVIETTVFYKNQTLYAISLESPFVKPVEENEKIYDQILSSFKFIE